jgi:hypothetical protein
MDWYVARDGETFGPFSFEVLVKGVREGELRLDDSVWSVGKPDWVPARTIPGLWAPPKLPGQGSPSAAYDAGLVVPPVSSALETQEPTREADRPRAESTQVGLVRRHWRGDLALPLSYWGIGVTVTLGLIALGHLFGSVNATLPFGPLGFGVAAGAFLIFVCMCTVWQLVGIWRSARSHIQSTGRRLWGSLARVAVVIVALGAVYDFNTVIGPMLAESGRIATRTEDVAPHQLRLLRDGTEVEVAGGMPLGTAVALRKLLDATPSVQVVHLNSVGGRVSEGYEIYHLVRDRKLITYTATNCMSACTIAFLGGVQRLLSTRALLGFHSISFAGIDQRLIPDINVELRQTLLSHGAPAWFVEKALNTNADSMWYPTKGELTAAKIVTGVVDPDQFGLSGIRNWRDQESLERGLLEIPLYALVRDNDPEMFKRVASRSQKELSSGAR